MSKALLNMKPGKSARQVADERRAAANRRALDREQAATDFLAKVKSKQKRRRSEPVWPVDARHAGALASAGSGHDSLHPADPSGSRSKSGRSRQSRGNKR
ncbi:MAG: hypothetical protein WCD36_12625 [Rhodanobacteraceae bacterium]